VRREVKAKMDSSDGLVNGEVYWAYEIIAYGCSGGQRAGEQQEMVDMTIPTWTRGVRRQEKKSVSPQGSLGTRGGTLPNPKTPLSLFTLSAKLRLEMSTATIPTTEWWCARIESPRIARSFISGY
jgi:hypothetical protein